MMRGFDEGNSGYIEGDSGGQTDDVDIDIPEGSYVFDATTVSLLGDGNSNNGAKKLEELENRLITDYYLYSDLDEGSRQQPVHSYFTGGEVAGKIKAQVSDGEYIMSRDAVTSLGQGDNELGAQRFDTMRDNIKEHAGINHKRNGGIIQKSRNVIDYLDDF